MRCDVQANPAIFEIHWLFNGRMVNQEFSIGKYSFLLFYILDLLIKESLIRSFP